MATRVTRSKSPSNPPPASSTSTATTTSKGLLSASNASTSSLMSSLNGTSKRKRDDTTPAASTSGQTTREPTEDIVSTIVPARAAAEKASAVNKAKADKSDKPEPKGKGKATKPAKATGKKGASKKSAAAARARARARAEEEDYSPTEDNDASYVPQREDDEEVDDRLYCVCQQLYDPERMMIACDRCDEWYHLDCIDVKENDVELINDFVCPRCEDTTDARTTWKSRCARTGCHKPAVALSKYCSDWCGIEVAAERLERTSLDPAKYWSAVVGVRKPVSIVARAHPSPTSPPSTALTGVEKALQAKLTEVATKRALAESHIALISARLRFLGIAVRRWEQMRDAHAAKTRGGTKIVEPEIVAVKGGKGKGKAAAKPKGKSHKAASSIIEEPEAPCGFDVRLVWDDADWETWVAAGELEREATRPVGVSEDAFVCVTSRKACDRHQGWQRLCEASFEAEKAGQGRKLDRFAQDERIARLRLDERAEEKRLYERHRLLYAGKELPIKRDESPQPLVRDGSATAMDSMQE